MNFHIPQDDIKRRIFLLRRHRVMLDKDLAELYGVKSIRLRQQVKRNRNRFPKDFMFQLSEKETNFMVSQNVIPSRKYLGGFRPYVFTELGVAMLSTILNSERAIQVNIAIMRAFVKIRKMLSTHKALAEKLGKLERKIERHDAEIDSIFGAIRQLTAPVDQPKRKIGFHPPA